VAPWNSTGRDGDTRAADRDGNRHEERSPAPPREHEGKGRETRGDNCTARPNSCGWHWQCPWTSWRSEPAKAQASEHLAVASSLFESDTTEPTSLAPLRFEKAWVFQRARRKCHLDGDVSSALTSIFFIRRT
jgi:hypothetical protein